MKRKKKSSIYPIVKIVKPFFWKECRFYHKEFRREQGFKIEDICAVQQTNCVETYNTYACTDCCKTIEDVKSKIYNSEIVHSMPPSSPPSQE